MRLINLIIILTAGMFLVGCTVGPDYAKPGQRLAGHFTEAQQIATTNKPVEDWWKTFHDPELDKLIDEALRGNYDLKAAYARVRESRFQRNIAAADLFPQVDADAGYARSRGSKNVILPLGGSGSSGGGSAKPQAQGKAQTQARTTAQSRGGQSEAGAANDSAFDNQLSPFGKGGLPGADWDLYQVGFDANWEIDVFGAKRREVEAANAEEQAMEEARRALTLSTMAEVARNYFDLRGAQQRLDIAGKNLDEQNEVLDLVRSQARSGLATDADVARAAAEAAQTDATIPGLQADAGKLIHSLSILTGREPESLEAELGKQQALPVLPPIIPIGLPSQLIERRPDIREAEREIAAANARIGSATADLFPKFALVASTGLDSSSAYNLFDWDSRYFLISPTVTWRIFDAGRIIANIRLQKAITQEAGLQFQSVLLKALQEVEDALINYAMERESRGKLEIACQQSQLAMDLARQRYDHGLATFLEVLDAERTVLSDQDALVESDMSMTTDLVALYKALGGGWESGETH